MTISEAISQVDALKPNTYSPAEKIRWLSTLDMGVKAEITDTHEGGEAFSDFAGYADDAAGDTELIACAPYDDIYILWLCAMIDYNNGETARYNNSVALYNARWSAYRNYYNSTHLPRETKMKFF